MVSTDEVGQNNELLSEENEEDEEENKIEENIKKKKKINSVTREQFKKFYTEKK